MLAMKPTPQESFSIERAYMPSAGGRQLCSRGVSSSKVSAGFEAAVADSVSATMFSRSNSDPLILFISKRLRASPHRRRTLDACGTHRATARPPRAAISLIQAWAFHVPEERPCLHCPGARGATVRCNPCAGTAPQLRQLYCPNSDHAKFLSITQARESPRPHADRRITAGEKPAGGRLRQRCRDPAQGPPDFAMKYWPGPAGERMLPLRPGGCGAYRSF